MLFSRARASWPLRSTVTGVLSLQAVSMEKIWFSVVWLSFLIWKIWDPLNPRKEASFSHSGPSWLAS